MNLCAPDPKALATSKDEKQTPTLSSGQSQPDYASRNAAILFGFYRRADANDPEVYLPAPQRT